MIAVVNALAKTSVKPHGLFGRAMRSIVHTREKDADAIRYHYDVSNEFYRAWLDPGMVYSCAYFETGEEDLATAQLKKIDHILAKIDLRPGQSLLDIGCGWGALVIRAAQRFGARCVGVTLSENQAQLAREQVERAGLQHLVEIRLQDYRDVTGQFDRITSVGMFEHVGIQHLPEYFSQHQRAAGAGRRGDEPRPDHHRRRQPRHALRRRRIHRPLRVSARRAGAPLRTVIRTMQQGGLEVRDVENLRRHYARTCAIWTDNFEANAERIQQLTDPKRFRIWHVYLAGCTYAFNHDWISLYQIVCGKAGQEPAALPWSRRYMYEQPPCWRRRRRLLQAIRERLLELGHLGRHHEGAIALQRMLVEIILVVVLGPVPGRGGLQFGHDRRVPDVGHFRDHVARDCFLLGRSDRR